MVEVIEFLFEGLVSRQIDLNLKINIEQIARELPNIGFEIDEIDSALSWLNETIFHSHPLDENLNSSHATRIYDSFELQKLDEKARGLLYFLEQNKMITPSVREFIIERALALHTNYIGKEEIRWVLLFVMMNSQARDDIIGWLEKNISELTLTKTKQEKPAKV